MAKLNFSEFTRKLKSKTTNPLIVIEASDGYLGELVVSEIKSRVFGTEVSEMSLGRYSADCSKISDIVNVCQTVPWGGGRQMAIVRRAESWDEHPDWLEILGPEREMDEGYCQLVLIFNALDARRKFTKYCDKKGWVVSCKVESEAERESWISRVAKKHDVILFPDELQRLMVLEPFSLNLAEQEIKKIVLTGSQDPRRTEGLWLGSLGAGMTSSDILDAFFERDKKALVQVASKFGRDPDGAFLFCGLLAWNLKALRSEILGQDSRVPPFVARKLKDWARLWNVAQIEKAESELCVLDHALKRRPLQNTGVWQNFFFRPH